MSQESILPTLPEEIIMNTIQYLPLSDLASLAHTCKTLQRLTGDNSYWKEKIECHFPHRIPSQKEEFLKIKNFKTFFRTLCEQEYSNVAPLPKKLFFIIKENDARRFQKEIENEQILPKKFTKKTGENPTTLKNFLMGTKDRNGVTALQWAVKKNNPSFLYALYSFLTGNERNSNKRLYWAVYCNQPEEIEALLKSNVNVNHTYRKDKTLLFVAARNGWDKVVEVLITQYNASLLKACDNGATPLYGAAEGGHAKIVDYLIKQGMSPLACTTQRKTTPLTIAAANGHEDVVKCLLEKESVRKTLQSNEGKKAIYLAAQNGHLPVVRLLVEKGVPFDTSDVTPVTPLFVAAENGHFAIVEFLLNQGANPDYYGNNKQCLWDVVYNKKLTGIAVLLWKAQVEIYLKNIPDIEEKKINSSFFLSEKKLAESLLIALQENKPITLSWGNQLGMWPQRLGLSSPTAIQTLYNRYHKLKLLENQENRRYSPLPSVTLSK